MANHLKNISIISKQKKTINYLFSTYNFKSSTKKEVHLWKKREWKRERNEGKKRKKSERRKRIRKGKRKCKRKVRG